MTAISNDALQFFRAWLTDPLRVAAITPSGRALSAIMTSEIAPGLPIIELGPGTGSFTRALVRRGVAEKDLVLVEFGTEFADQLRTRFPEANVMHMDATQLRYVNFSDGCRASAVLSGLPVLSMRTKKIIAILDGAFRHLRPDGAFYQFTYGPRCPISRPVLDRMGLKATCIGHTFANIPPAAVYRITRRAPRPSPIPAFDTTKPVATSH